VWEINRLNYDLELNDVHVWKILISDHFHKLFKDYKFILNEQELNRAKRYHSKQDFQRYLTGRITLRILLGKYLGLQAASIPFDFEYKKPTTGLKNSLKFNLSYSNEYIVISMSLNETGIDIEKIDTCLDYNSLLASCFSDKEIKNIKESIDKRHENFFLQWTRKEALLKFTGQGIIDDLSNIPSLDGNHSIKKTKLKIKEDINLTSFFLNENFVGTVVYPVYISRIKYLEW